MAVTPRFRLSPDARGIALVRFTAGACFGRRHAALPVRRRPATQTCLMEVSMDANELGDRSVDVGAHRGGKPFLTGVKAMRERA